ncbi:DUF2786 domain-containing protein [Snodgrassella sp. CFCC 13594]|uniref:DUF2786 domain-containing protein n=1 Tax=Snodgrassella sp. CFCC 13594 TaxID=1775559 RepID=UPI000833F769|nr:DUF2786 domain-containing protein [Snodgrassella sp. CFCC 13594]
MDKKTALEKIKKCLRLAKSANEHEAAQALKQAQALMREHGVTDFDVVLSEVTEAGVKTPVACPRWQHGLFNVCKKAFGCGGYIEKDFDYLANRYTASYKFYGVAPKPELASYAYEVLLRQIRAARRQYIAIELKRVRSTKNKTYRADQFCEGWVVAVLNKVEVFANTLEEQQKLDSYFARLGEMKPTKVRGSNVKGSVKNSAAYDRSNGYAQGQDAQLNHAMNGGEEQKRLGV